jgi:hypothetical protein
MAELQAAQVGGFGIYPQDALGQTDATTEDFYWFMGNMFDVGPQQILRDLGQLVGGGLLPLGQVKTGVFSGGRAVMPPILDSQLWWMFYAFAGSVEAEAGEQVVGNVYKHYMPDKTAGDDTPPDKYLCIHKILPTDGDDVGEELRDQTVVRLQLGITGGEFVTFQSDFMGKRPVKFVATGAGWDKDPHIPKGKRSVPIAARSAGGVQLPIGSSLEAVQAVVIDMVNLIPAFRDVAQVGSFDPHSFKVLGRTPVLTLSQLYHTADLYNSAFYSGSGEWEPDVFNTDFEVDAQSASWIRSEEGTDVTGPAAYQTSPNPGFQDPGQDFTAWETTAPGDALYWIEVLNADGNVQSWAYCGDSNDVPLAGEGIDVYKDKALTSTLRGWARGGTGTVGSYFVHACQRYEVGFKATSVDWTATPPVLAGGELMRVDFTGTVNQAESGLDWLSWVVNRNGGAQTLERAPYTWPVP